MTRYVKSRRLQVEECTEDESVLLHTYLGTRLRLDRKTLSFLDLFEEPASIEDLSKLGDVSKAMPVLRRLCQAGFLHEEGHRETLSDKLVQRARTGFFGCPSVADSEVRSDFTFLGVPLDFGNHRGAGARGGPGALRQRSLESYRNFRLGEEGHEPTGFFDHDLERSLLNGARLDDAGDLFLSPSQSPTSVFANLQTIVRGIREEGGFPVLLGGDHSLTYPVLAALDEPVDVVHIDAHSDRATYYDGAEHHHGNFMTRALRLEHVVAVRQIGIRNIALRRQTEPSGKIRQVTTVRQLRRRGIDEILSGWQDPSSQPPGKEAPRCYLTFDIDSLDPSVAPGTTTPMPGGLLFDEAKDLLWALGSRFDFLGFDLVEVNPERDPNGVTELVALELVLTFLGAQFERRRRVPSR